MNEAAHVPELGEDAAARAVHGIGYFPPVSDALGAPQPAGVRPTAAFEADVGCLRYDQPRRGSLGIVRGHEVGRNMVARSAAPGQRRHPDSVGAGEAANFYRVKQCSHEIPGKKLRVPGGMLAELGVRAIALIAYNV